jgi:hypothetical protein
MFLLGHLDRSGVGSAIIIILALLGRRMWGSNLSAEQVHGFVAGYAFVTLDLVVDIVSLQRAGGEYGGVHIMVLVWFIRQLLKSGTKGSLCRVARLWT